jgi:hypothetical protein
MDWTIFVARKYNAKKFLLLMYAIVTILTIDLILNNAVQSGNIKIQPNITEVIFAIEIIAYIIVQYFILGYTNYRVKNITQRSVYVTLIQRSMNIIQLIFAALMSIAVLQIIANSYYSTVLITWSSTFSYLLAGAIAIVLTQMFFTWYNVNRTLPILMYSVASCTIVISVALTIVFADVSLFSLPSERTIESVLPDLFYPMNSPMGMEQYVWAVSNAVNYFMLWICSVLLLRQYSSTLGRVKLYTVLCIPLLSIVYQYGFASALTESLQGVSNANPNLAFLIILGDTIPSIAFGITFGIPFWLVGRTMQRDSDLRYCMIISAFGLILLEVTTSADVTTGQYPPFGLPSVLSVALSLYLILIGLYYSAISISGNIKLRQTIRSIAIEQSKLLDNLGMAQLQKELNKNIKSVLRRDSEIMNEQSGVTMELSDDDIKKYLNEVLEEVGKSRASTNTDNDSKV